MMLKMTKVEVWSAEIDDQPGGLALAMQAVADYGADLDCVIARRHPEKAGKGVVSVTSSGSAVALENAAAAGFRRASRVATLKVEGANQRGLGAKLTRIIADAGVSMLGLTAAVVGHRFVCYIGFDSLADLERAELALRPLAERHWPSWTGLAGHKKEEKVKVPA